MFYTLDIGNTNQTIIKHKSFDLFNEVSESLGKIDDQHLIYISSVHDDRIPKIKNIKRTKDFLQNNLLFEMQVHYEASLGEDRLTSAYYLYKKSPRRKVHIDSGSFTTLDVIDSKGFQGGFILPGVKKVLDTYTQGKNLYSPSFKRNNQIEIPQTTKDALEHGAYFTITAPLKEIITHLKPDEIYISGGNAKLVHNALKDEGISNLILSHNLVHRGLFEVAKRSLQK